MTDKRIKLYLKDRLKRLEDLKNERRWATSEHDGAERWWTTAELGDMACCKQTLEFIDSLQEEPVSDDLEEEIDNYIKRNGYDGIDSEEEVKCIANHFAKWQKENLRKPADGNDLPEKDHLSEVRKKVADKLLEASLNYYEAERACCEMHVPQEWKDERKKLYDEFIWTCQDYIILNESDEIEEDELNYRYE